MNEPVTSVERMNFEREIKFVPTIMGLECKFYLKGAKGIIQFCISTGWGNGSEVYPYEVGYHSPVPLYEDHKPMSKKCGFYDPCYYGGSGMYAKDVFKILIKEGHEGVWDELEVAYNRWLEG